jgi:hypothetical protein
MYDVPALVISSIQGIYFTFLCKKILHEPKSADAHIFTYFDQNPLSFSLRTMKKNNSEKKKNP